MKEIKISEQLRDYIERLNYEENRYADLLGIIRRDSCPMTDDEWDSSYKYYNKLFQEAKLCKQFALEEIKEMYADEIGNEPWHIYFDESAIIVGPKKLPVYEGMGRQYSDYLIRLYPEESQEMAINSNHVYDITLQVTDACNMACTYCYQHNKGTHSMSFETAKRFLDMILDADEMTNTYITSTAAKGVVINFIGGEPWLEIDLITKVSDYFIGELFRRKHPWATRFMFSFSSNGLLHFDPRVQKYLKKHIKHLSYGISIDGNKELHDACRVDLAGNGTYDRAIAAVHDYRNNLGGLMGSKMTIAPGNVDKIFKAVANMIEENNYKKINLNCVFEKGWTNEHANTLYWELHKITDWLAENNLLNDIELSIFDIYCGHPYKETENSNWCGGTGLMVAIDYKGDIYPCLRYMESSVGNNVSPFIIGNLSCGINREKEHCDRVNCMSCITRRSQSTDECFNCPISRGCAWCSAYNYEVFGTPDKRATFICCMHKARVLANVYYWRKRGIPYPMNCPKEWAIEIIGEEEFEKLNNMEVDSKWI